MKKTDGFTLIELLVGILCASLITGAAMSTLLMGARVNRSLSNSNTDQQNTRIIASLIESLASEGSIKTVVTVGNVHPDEEGKNDWALLDEDGNTIVNYSFSNSTIYSQGSVPLMENVTASRMALSDSETITGRLLDFTLETEDGVYKSSVFCRTANIGKKTIDSEKLESDFENENPDIEIDDDISISISASEQTGRFALLEVLCTQYGSTGEIEQNTGNYFSEWYLKKAFGYSSYELYNNDHPGLPPWGPTTPWCGCFLSWGIDQISEYLAEGTIPCFANVQVGSEIFTKHEYGAWHAGGTYLPGAGDLIFFSWDSSEIYHHVGAVFYTDSQYVYTIEGNNSGRVELNRYALNDTSIVGYGVLDWK